MKLGLFAMVLLSSFSVFSQENNAMAAENNFYSAALSASMDMMAGSWGYIDDSKCGYGCTRIRTDYKNLIVQKNFELTDKLPNVFGNRSVEYVDSQGLIDKYKKLRKEFSILIIHPMKNEGNDLSISVTVHWFRYSKGISYYGISDWSNVIFRFDCEKKAFAIHEVKLGGI